MIKLFRLLLVVLAIELLISGDLIVHQMRRPVPILPRANPADPLIMGDLRRLTQNARTGTSEQWQELAEALLGQGFYSYAEICFRRVVETNPDHQLAQYSLALCLDRTGRMQESTAEYRKAAALKTEQTTNSNFKRFSLYGIGRNFLRQENLSEAEETFRQNRGFLPAEYQLAKILIRSGRAEKALPIIDKVLKQVPDSLGFHFLQYRAMKALGRTEEAIQAADNLKRSRYQIPLNLKTDFIEPYSKKYGLNKMLENYNRLRSAQDMDRMAEALGKILTLVRGRNLPHYKLVLMRLAEVEFQRKNPKRMLSLLEELKDFGENNADMLQLEGAAYAISGKMEKAVALWQRALRMSPNVPLHQRLAKYYEQQKDDSKRNFHLGKMNLIKAKMLYRNNELAPAKQSVQKSISLNPRDPQAWFYQAEIHRLLENLGKARDAYRQCLELAPNYGRALRQLKQIEEIHR